MPSPEMFDAWLEAELHTLLPADDGSAPARPPAAAPARRWSRLLGWLIPPVSGKLLVATTALAVAGTAGAAAASGRVSLSIDHHNRPVVRGLAAPANNQPADGSRPGAPATPGGPGPEHQPAGTAGATGGLSPNPEAGPDGGADRSADSPHAAESAGPNESSDPRESPPTGGSPRPSDLPKPGASPEPTG